MLNNSKEIKEKFVKYFIKNNHKNYKSSKLMLDYDNSVLFVNSGMVQFKKYFLELEEPKDKNIVTIQNCIRIDGKHNDLNEVGISLNHHTFFEMMGNFSFGGYEKEESCKLAWDFLTKELNIKKNDLYITYFKGDNIIAEDEETLSIWKKIGIKENNIRALNKKNNFWSMGKTGPCGPCTEIHFLEKENNLIEIWNIVFMQYEKNGNNIKKKKKTFIDTGMGLERLCRIMQNKQNNYETDIFEKYTNIFIKNKIKNSKNNSSGEDISIRIIIDHLRTASFLISEGLIPKNESRGYVLKKILRRIFLNNIKINNFEINNEIIRKIIESMQEEYEILNNKEKKINRIIEKEKKNFLSLLKNSEKNIKLFLKKTNKKKITEKEFFFFYGTYGIPVEITKNVCEKNKISFSFKNNNNNKKKKIYITQKTKIFKKNKITSKIIKLIKIKKKNRIALILNKTIFYYEAGGQISDIGKIKNKEFLGKIKNVKNFNNSILHYVRIVKGYLKKNDKIKIYINKKKRKLISQNHTTTHILSGIVRKFLKNDYIQKGSFITDKFLRFDFINNKKINKKNIKKIEKAVNKKIQKQVKLITIKEKIKKINKKKITLNNLENYPNTVKIIKINNFLELCCGTHVKNTKNIKIFKIIEFFNISKNISRIKAITNKQINKNNKTNENIINSLINITKKNKKEIKNFIINTIEENKKNEKEKKNTIDKIEIKNIIKKIKETKNNNIIYYTNNKNIIKKNLLYFEICRLLTEKRIFIINKEIKKNTNILINFKETKNLKKTFYIMQKKKIDLKIFKIIKIEKNNTVQLLINSLEEEIERVLYYLKL